MTCDEQPSPEALDRFCGPLCRGLRCAGCVERERRRRAAAEEAQRAAALVERATVRRLEEEALSVERDHAARVEETDARRIAWALRLVRVRRYLGWAT